MITEPRKRLFLFRAQASGKMGFDTPLGFDTWRRGATTQPAGLLNHREMTKAK